MVRGLPVFLVAAALVPASAEARPKADLVIAWAPGVSIAPIEAAARDAGAAVLDRSPAPRPRLATAETLRRAIAAFDAAKLDDAQRLFDEAKAEIDRTGAADLTGTQLSDLFLYRGLIADQREDTTAAWDELVAAIIVAPTRMLDPQRFSPRVLATLDRARQMVEQRGTAVLRVDVPAGCVATVDGVRVASQLMPLGTHWVSVTCSAAQPWGTRVELASEATVVARNAPIAPPTSDEMLIQARISGARAFVAIELTGEVGVVRLVGADGRERDRRTVTVHGDLAPVAVALRAMLAPAPTRHWYDSRWAWAGGAALVAAAILIPITAAAAGDTTSPTVGVRVPNPW